MTGVQTCALPIFDCKHRKKFVRSVGIRQDAGGQYWSSSSSDCLSTNADCLIRPLGSYDLK